MKKSGFIWKKQMPFCMCLLMKSNNAKMIDSLILLCFLLFSSSVTVFAQWSIKKSRLSGSGLEEILKTKSHLVQVFSDAEWDASNFASQKDLQWFEDAKYGMFIHFGLSTFVNKELSWGTVGDKKLPDKYLANENIYPREEWTSWADSLKLENFSKKELAKIIKESGVKYLVVVAKHHEGFHLWDTQYSNFKSTNSPYNKDFVREVVDACHSAGIKVGIYYSQRDWYHPDYEPVDPETVEQIASPPLYRAKEGKTVKMGACHRKYIDYQFDVVRELCTNYGKIDVFWFDAVYWGGMYTADMWDAERLTRMIRRLQPGILINNRASLPGDFDTPEQRIGIFQNHRPWESCMCLCETWSYSPSAVKSPLTVFQKLQSTAVRGGNLLLSWGMKWDGSWDEKQKNTFVQVGDFLKRYRHSIYNTHGGPWLPDVWGGTTFKNNKIYVHIVKETENKNIFLPKLAGFRVVKSEDMSGHGLALREVPGGYAIDTKVLGKIESPVIMELTVDKLLTVADVESPEGLSGCGAEKILGTQKIVSGRCSRVKLDGVQFIKKVKFESSCPLKGSITLSFSKDGKEWKKQEPVLVSDRKVIIPVASYTAGALLDGAESGYVEIVFSERVTGTVVCTVLGDS